VTWLRRIFADLSLRRPEYDPRSIRVVFVVNKLFLGQVDFPVLWFYPVSIIPPLLRAHLHLHATLTRGSIGQSLGTFWRAVLFWNSGGVGLMSTDMRRLATGMHSRKCVVGQFRRRANVIECTYLNLDNIAYYRYASLNDGDTFWEVRR